jgi:hypothetical protein
MNRKLFVMDDDDISKTLVNKLHRSIFTSLCKLDTTSADHNACKMW